jgi:hypothetical protein
MGFVVDKICNRLDHTAPWSSVGALSLTWHLAYHRLDGWELFTKQGTGVFLFIVTSRMVDLPQHKKPGV